MAWQSYSLDQKAHDLVLRYRDQTVNGATVLNQSHKMRSTVAFGLERFWGEHLRLQGNAQGDYWRDVWQELVNIMRQAGVNLPNDPVSPDNTNAIRQMTNQLWSFDQKQRKVALAVLTQLCDSLVWWTQRYKR
jgi:hypothetical protein